MLTLVVLSALAAIATAAPALSEKRYIGHSPASFQIKPTTRREKKSPIETNHNVAQLLEVQQFPRSEINYGAEISSSKKPIIAVENQHAKQDWKYSEVEPNVEVHKNIEVAREAVEHIQENFGNLKAMNLRAATLSNTEPLQSAHSRMTTEQRMEQWKEAVNNIEKNAEIDRNLEEHLTVVNDQAHMSQSLETKLMKHGSSSELQNVHKTDWLPKIAEHGNSEASASSTQAEFWHVDRPISMKNAAIKQSTTDLHNTGMQRVVTFGSRSSHHNTMPLHNHHHHQHHHQQYHHQHQQPHFPNHYEFHHHPSHDNHHKFHGHGMHFKTGEHANIEGKAAEKDNFAQGTLQMNINEPSSKSAIEHTTDRKQEKMVTDRGVYINGDSTGIGTSGVRLSIANSGGPGAIGLFPRANKEGRATPLLLSCSPTITIISGSLARTQHGYEASAYRAGENFHTKRDIKTNYKVPAIKAKWSPVKIR